MGVRGDELKRLRGLDRKKEPRQFVGETSGVVLLHAIAHKKPHSIIVSQHGRERQDQDERLYDSTEEPRSGSTPEGFSQ